MADLKLTGGRELEAELAKLEKKTQEKTLKKHVRGSTNIFLRAIRKETPTDTGALRKQTKTGVKVLRRTGYVSGLVKVKSKKFDTGRNPVHYQHLVTGGSVAHLIVGPLAFGSRVYSQVRHRGATPNRYVDRAFDRVVKEVNADLARSLQKSLLGV